MAIPQSTLIVGAVVLTIDAGKSLRQAELLSALPARSVIVPCDRRHLQRGGVLAGRHRVAEDQRAGAGAADIGGGAAVVERQRRRAGDGHRLAHVERQRQRLAGIVVAGAVAVTDDTVGAVVSICGAVWVRPVSDRLAALPAPSVMVAAVEIDPGHRQAAVFWPAATV